MCLLKLWLLQLFLRLSVLPESLSKYKKENQNNQHSLMISDAKTHTVALVTLYTQCCF